MSRLARMGVWTIALLAALGGALAIADESRAQTPSYSDAVVLVSGFDTASPFTTPDPSCDGQEGEEWNPPTGIAAELKSRGDAVFTAPVRQAGENPEQPCPATGSPLPPVASTYINSNGDVDANGAALGRFLAFLGDEYGVERVQLVAHSDGGLWSRSAITQADLYPNVEVRSLTTLGTPHTGSFGADLALELQNGQCDFSGAEQVICDLLQGTLDAMLADLGQATVQQLTNDFLATWNPQQSIGGCRVTTLAGTYVDVLVPFDYYNPSDGIVGQASALAEYAYTFTFHRIPAPDIPNLRNGGSFPVVHSGLLSSLTQNNLLNYQPISDAVADTVAATPSGDPACNPGGPSGAARPGAARLRLQLTKLSVPSASGTLPEPRRDDNVIVRPRTRVGCDGRRLETFPLLGQRRLRTVSPATCDGPLRVRDRGRRAAARGREPAVLLRSHPQLEAAVRVTGDSVRIGVLGPDVRRLRALVRQGGRWRRLDLDRRGRAQLPGRGELARLRIVVHPQKGARRTTGHAVVAR